ncbi:MAG TPA: thiamine pyrophosphate-dependent dehydrogenase E1 component subunit alpha [Anaerolineaceae bacterium]|nr:thiamine pyrophosphate-dependent dehydrogenase E1 component subunit alpha [Anaerolineaceae bacterium]HQP07479.1 thiamine pyrophosphate-dependent dehydrogenase E1 component subunit alpha [Anaerolineaceae bacterium]
MPKAKSKETLVEKAARLGLSNEDLVGMLRTMYLIRQFEYMADRLYALGKVHGTMHLSAGQEAVAVGISKATRKDDYLINHHRGHGHFISKGADINLMMSEFLGKENGYCKGRGGSMHIADFTSNNLGANGIVGGGIPHSLGVGLAIKHRKSDALVITLFGDGAANEGVFHETLNMAALWKIPSLYVCENNKYGMSMDVERATAKLPIAQRAEGYGIPWYVIDGNDLLLVYETMKNAADYIRAENGPVLVETQTYRYFGHSKSDRNLYRSKEEIDSWRTTKDPITRFRGQLVEEKIITDELADQLDKEGLKINEDAVAFAEASPEPDPSTVTEYVYA